MVKNKAKKGPKPIRVASRQIKDHKERMIARRAEQNKRQSPWTKGGSMHANAARFAAFCREFHAGRAAFSSKKRK